MGAEERKAYADAGFTLMMAVDDEMRKGRSPSSEALTANVLACVDRIQALGMLALVDGYVEIHHEGWGGAATRAGRVVRMTEEAFDPSVAQSRPLRKPSAPEVCCRAYAHVRTSSHMRRRGCVPYVVTVLKHKQCVSRMIDEQDAREEETHTLTRGQT